MNKYLAIASELARVNDAKFQILCNQFLYEQYGNDLSSPGQVIDKEKTKSGRPDAFVRFDDGSYLIAEYTTKDGTDKSGLLAKLESDLNGCFQFDELGIQKQQVRQIVLCCNSSLDSRMQEYLNKVAAPYSIPLRMVGIESLALFLCNSGKLVARDLFSISLDVGQLLTLQQFTAQYSRKDIATPLDNPFVERKDKIKEIVDAIVGHKIVIIKGSQGVGKSRLALRSIEAFINDNKLYNVLCVVRKTDSLAEDLLDYMEPGKNYLFFIDDANRQLNHLLSILNSQAESTGNIRIVITVRDYAKADVIKHCYLYKPKIIDIEILRDDIIEEIVKSLSYDLSNFLIAQIVKISKGNPRIAIMAAKVAGKNPAMTALKDISEIYEQYYQGIIGDNAFFEEHETTKTIGLISFFFGLDFEQPDLPDILRDFDLSNDRFIEIIDKLQALEVVDVYLNSVVKITEQVMATYFFYKAFFKSRLLDFEILMTKYFHQYYHRVRDSFEPATDAFGSDKILQPVKDILHNYWGMVSDNYNEAIRYLEVFGKYFPQQVFVFTANETAKIGYTQQDAVLFHVPQSYNFSFFPVVKLLELFYKSEERYIVLTALQLSLEYARKNTKSYGDIVNNLRKSLQITNDDIEHGCWRQQEMVDFFTDNFPSDKIGIYLSCELFVGCILAGRLSNGAYVRKETDEWELLPDLQKLRGAIWRILTDRYLEYKEIIDEMLVMYLDDLEYAYDIAIIYDAPYLVKLAEYNFTVNNLSDCLLVYKYDRFLTGRGIDVSAVKNLQSKFVNKTFETCITLAPSTHSGKSIYQAFAGHAEIGLFKESEIQKKILIRTLTDYRNIHAHIIEIQEYKYASKFNLWPLVDSLLGPIIRQNTALGFKILDYILKDGNRVRLHPVNVYRAVFKAKRGWQVKLTMLLDKYSFKDAEIWKERFYFFLPEEQIGRETVSRLLDFYRETTASVEIQANILDAYKKIEPLIYRQVIQVLIDRRKKTNSFKYNIGYHFFRDQPEEVAAAPALCREAYRQQLDINKNYDQDGSDLISLLRVDETIIDECMDYILSLDILERLHVRRAFTGIWEESRAETAVACALTRFISAKNYAVSEQLANMFFISLPEKCQERVFVFLTGFIDIRNSDVKAMSMVLDIGRNCMPAYYLRLIRHFLLTNRDIEIFRRLEWHNNHFSSNGTVFWSDFKAAELRKIHSLIESLPQPYLYMYHLIDIEQRISLEEKYGEYERKMKFISRW